MLLNHVALHVTCKHRGGVFLTSQKWINHGAAHCYVTEYVAHCLLSNAT
jgi:hypothetical protein